MSSKKDREQKLLLLLSKTQEYLTSEDLAETLHTSQKTIYRLIKKINANFPNGRLILSEKGRGYKLDKEKFIGQNMLKQSKASYFSPRERRNRIMEELLLSSPKAKKVYDLYEAYFVGESVIFTDEQAISEQLQSYNLRLVRKQRTVAIQGDEAAIRKAIADLIQLSNVIDIDEIKTNEELNLNHYDVCFILEQLRFMEKQLDITLPYPYNINIFSHLYILISRSKKVGTAVLSERSISGFEEVKGDEKEQLLYKVASATIRKIEHYLMKKLPESEIYYLYQYLVSSRMQGSFSKVTTFSAIVTQITQRYLDEMAVKLNVPMKGEAIFLDLANHIKPMLNRLRHGIQVKNSLLSQIMMTYEDIFSQVKEVSDFISITFDLPVVNDDENGFITLYFARIIETNQLPIRTIIMCTTGIGTSELLKVKVEKKFPELEIIDVLASRNAKNLMEKYAGIDLILSTVQLPETVSIPYLLVSAMFNADDQNRLQKKIEAIYHER